MVADQGHLPGIQALLSLLAQPVQATEFNGGVKKGFEHSGMGKISPFLPGGQKSVSGNFFGRFLLSGDFVGKQGEAGIVGAEKIGKTVFLALLKG